jgi:hypothetical protein
MNNLLPLALPLSNKIVYICPSPDTDAEDGEHEESIILGPVILHVCYGRRDGR